MKVFNLLPHPLVYRGIELPANGGSFEYEDPFYIPARDLALEKSKVLAFGAIPSWWKAPDTK